MTDLSGHDLAANDLSSFPAEPPFMVGRSNNAWLLHWLPFRVELISADGSVMAANQAAASLRARYTQTPEWRRLVERLRVHDQADAEVPVPGHDGTTRWWRLLARRLGPGMPILVGSTEITEHRRMEEELDQARRRSETLAKARMRFLATMSHEIRTPMNGIIGMVRLLGQTKLDARQRHYVKTIAHSGDTLMTILNDVLDFTKLEADKFTLETIAFDLRATVREAFELIQGRGEEKGLVCAMAVAPDVPPFVQGDATRLRQVLLNLLSNAVKFTSAGRIDLQVEVVQQEQNAVRLRFSVRDTGPGIAAEDQGKLFQDFSQADPSISRRFGGTGLGLAICRRIVDLLGGTIGIDSEVGKGSCFWFELALPLAAAGAAEEEEGGLRPAARPLRILLAEDNPVNQEVTVALLRSCGHKVTVVGDGRAAVQAVTSQPFDVVLMDVQMPLLDGIEATALIRRMPSKAELPIIALTASVFDEDRERCAEAGMNGYIAKPVEPRRLQHVLESLSIVGRRDPDEAPDPGALKQEQLDQLALLMGSDKLLALLHDYAQNASGMILAIHKAIADGDITTVRRLAHDLKSNSGSFGLTGIAALAFDIEQAAHDRDLPRARALAVRLDGYLAEALASLRRRFPRLPL